MRGAWAKIRTALPLAMLILMTCVGSGAFALDGGRKGGLKALVIGNGAYPHLGNLDNPPNDVTDISRYLLNLKFEVTTRLDLPYRQSREVIERFLASLATDDTALFYYSGHAMQINGQNYLLPSDANGEKQSELQQSAININDIIRRLEKRSGVNLIFLDACRNNPFVRKAAAYEEATAAAERSGGSRGAGSSRSAGGAGNSGDYSGQYVPQHVPQQGLAAIRSNSGNTLIVYAAAAGKLAEDGTGQRNSPFTHSILKHIGAPDVEVEVMLKRVTKDVRALTNGRQSPERLSRLGDEFYFNRKKQKVAVLTPPPNIFRQPSSGKPAQRQPGQSFQDCQNCPEMIVIPRGSYQMGARPGGDFSSATDLPLHQVTISHALAVSRSEISFNQWDACVSDGGCRHYRPKDSGWGRNNRPVMNVSWSDAKAYADWLAAKTGKPYRLLSEAEWEYAARAGQKNGGGANSRRRLAISPKLVNFDGSTLYIKGRPGLYRGKTVSVNELQPNAFGLYNMRGNVSEWVADCWFDSGAFSSGAFPNGAFSSVRGATARGEAWSRDNCRNRVARGGSWYNEASELRLSARHKFTSSTRLNILGFRLALSLR